MNGENAVETAKDVIGTTAVEQRPGMAFDELAGLQADTMVDETRLAALLNVNPRTIPRQVRRGELPPPVKLGKRRIWFVGRVVTFLQARAERAAREAERQTRKFSTFSD